MLKISCYFFSFFNFSVESLALRNSITYEFVEIACVFARAERENLFHFRRKASSTKTNFARTKFILIVQVEWENSELQHGKRSNNVSTEHRENKSVVKAKRKYD